MVLLENDVFLTELTRMFNKSRTQGTGVVQLTMKKYDGRDKPVPKKRTKKSKKKKGKAAEPIKEIKKPNPHHHPVDQTTCLIRAKLHTKKLSTLVSSKDVNKFQLAYCNLLKGNMDGLKKIKKTKKGPKLAT